MSIQTLSDRSRYKVRGLFGRICSVDGSIPAQTGIANAANVSHQQHGSERICHIALLTVSTFIQILNFFWNISKRFGTIIYVIYKYMVIFYLLMSYTYISSVDISFPPLVGGLEVFEDLRRSLERQEAQGLRWVRSNFTALGCKKMMEIVPDVKVRTVLLQARLVWWFGTNQAADTSLMTP